MSSSRVERGEKHPSAYMENAGKTQLLLTSKCFLLQKAQSGCENDFSQFSHLVSKKQQEEIKQKNALNCNIVANNETERLTDIKRKMQIACKHAVCLSADVVTLNFGTSKGENSKKQTSNLLNQNAP